MAAGPPGSTLVTVDSNGAGAAPGAAARTTPLDGRLLEPYVSRSYQAGSGALGSFRIDPAPATTRPRMTEQQALAAFEASDAGPRPSGAQTVTVARFGLFSGNVENAPAPDGTLTGTHPVDLEPAWLIVFDGVDLRASGPLRNPDAPSTSGAADPRKGHAVVVISDKTAQPLLAGMTISSGPSGVR